MSFPFLSLYIYFCIETISEAEGRDLNSAKSIGLNPSWEKKAALRRQIYLSLFPNPSTPFMAINAAMRPLLRLPHQKGASEFATTARRTLTTHSTALHQSRTLIRLSIIPQCPRSSQQQSFRRSYADAKPQKYFRRSRITLRWLWRAVYLGAIGSVGYLGYTIYLLRTPSEQLEADPTKKTLVILGTTYQLEVGPQPLTSLRHWMGCRISSQDFGQVPLDFAHFSIFNAT